MIAIVNLLLRQFYSENVVLWETSEQLNVRSFIILLSMEALTSFN